MSNQIRFIEPPVISREVVDYVKDLHNRLRIFMLSGGITANAREYEQARRAMAAVREIIDRRAAMAAHSIRIEYVRDLAAITEQHPTEDPLVDIGGEGGNA